MRNKYYAVSDKNNDESTNIVIARTAKEAKKISGFNEGTENAESWIDLKVKAVKAGDSFWYDFGEGRFDFYVGGEGFFYTDREPQLDSLWDYFINDLKYTGRFCKDDEELY